jgi:hypothetical protein
MYRIYCLLVSFCIHLTFSHAQTLTTSNLPIVLINTNGLTILDEPKITARMSIIYNGVGLTNAVTDAVHFKSTIGIEMRGSTSQSISAKKPYSIELRDSATNLERQDRILGMSKESDWSLIAPYSDKSLIRDALMYRLAEDVLNWAPRTRFCELVLNGSYQGVYVLTEKIKRDGGRVDIAKSNPTNPAESGFIIKIDKSTGISGGWVSARQTNYLYHYPNLTDISAAQKTYIQNYFANFERVMQSTQYADSLTGYPKYLGINTFINFILLNELARNVDGYRISTYLHKDRDSINGHLKAGPVWDFNIALGNANYCEGQSTSGWAWDFNVVCPADGLKVPFWWTKLAEEPAFRKKMKARWTELRQTKWTNAYIMGLADSLSGVVNASQGRNFQRWNILTQWVWPNATVPGTYNGEINYLKKWMENRLIWLDGSLNTGIVTPHPREWSTLEVFPNPAFGDVHFYYYLFNASTVKILIYNALGQVVETMEAQQTNGRQEWIWNKPKVSGAYFYQIWQNDFMWQSGKLLVH